MDAGLLIWFQVVVPVLVGAACLLMQSPRTVLASVAGGSVVMAASAAGAAWAVHALGPIHAVGEWFLLDALSAYHLVLLEIVFCLSSFYAWRYFGHEQEAGHFDLRIARRFGALWFGAAASMTLVLVSNNLGILWVSVEATTLLTAFLICLHVTPSSLEAMWKYLIMCSVGVAFAFIGTLLVGASAGPAAPGGVPGTDPNAAAPGTPPTPAPAGWWSNDWRSQWRQERWQQRAEHWQQRAERREYHEHGGPGLVFGLLLILVGGMLAWHQFDPSFDLNLTWPILVIALGAILVVSSFRFRDR